MLISSNQKYKQDITAPICIDSTLPEPNSKSQIEMDRNGMRIAENFSNYPFSPPPELEVKGEESRAHFNRTSRYGTNPLMEIEKWERDEIENGSIRLSFAGGRKTFAPS